MAKKGLSDYTGILHFLIVVIASIVFFLIAKNYLSDFILIMVQIIFVVLVAIISGQILHKEKINLKFWHDKDIGRFIFGILGLGVIVLVGGLLYKYSVIDIYLFLVFLLVGLIVFMMLMVITKKILGYKPKNDKQHEKLINIAKENKELSEKTLIKQETNANKLDLVNDNSEAIINKQDKSEKYYSSINKNLTELQEKTKTQYDHLLSNSEDIKELDNAILLNQDDHKNIINSAKDSIEEVQKEQKTSNEKLEIKHGTVDEKLNTVIDNSTTIVKNQEIVKEVSSNINENLALVKNENSKNYKELINNSEDYKKLNKTILENQNNNKKIINTTQNNIEEVIKRQKLSESKLDLIDENVLETKNVCSQQNTDLKSLVNKNNNIAESIDRKHSRIKSIVKNAFSEALDQNENDFQKKSQVLALMNILKNEGINPDKFRKDKYISADCAKKILAVANPGIPPNSLKYIFRTLRKEKKIEFYKGIWGKYLLIDYVNFISNEYKINLHFIK
ncbi:MAG TPA: hypothetical protein QF753_12710 [Victivallales bacterium]|nr:hypothetical protein [Victivallales bacterium]